MSANRIVVGARYGMFDWLVQRLSAVVMALYTVMLIVTLSTLGELNYGSWAGLFAGVWMKVATLVAMLALLYHAWVGVRDIYMDYIKPAGIRLTLEMATVVALIGYAVWTAIILWRV